jgi:hypothetical protein
MSYTVYMVSCNSIIHATCSLTFMAYNYSELQGQLQNTLFLIVVWGVYTLRWPYMDITMAIFPIYPRYKIINKIKFIEIIEKRIHLSKVIIINLLRMRKSNQNHG